MSVVFRFDDDPELADIRIGLVEARGLAWALNGSGLDPRFQECIGGFCKENGAAVSSARKTAVREMLRHGAYKPAGRGKPSSEYLVTAALGGEFPIVNFFVDAANAVSLVSGYPISLIDRDKSGSDLLLRLGQKGESYIFNSSDQVISLADLICVCRKEAVDGFTPTANPVRDSMATKLFPGAGSAVAVIYAPAGHEGRDLETACVRLAGFLGERAESVRWAIVASRGQEKRQSLP
ncbi:MAG: hypothetical protein LLF89_08370 [Spirochaetaceae bacterium]|nr:hypothetical protein [Spirochaetaceae bacterium]